MRKTIDHIGVRRQIRNFPGLGLSTIIRIVLISAMFTWLTSPAAAHGFGQQYDLPLPLGLWVMGAGATIILTFVTMALYLREAPAGRGFPKINLLNISLLRWLAHPVVVRTIRAVSALAFLFIIYAGFVGSEDPDKNIITTIVWVTWWVGFAFICALVGNLWTLVNPIHTIFVWAEWAFSQATGGGSLARNIPYPHWLQTWPGVIILIGFAWAELVWGANDIPRNLAIAILSYSAVSWVGMIIWGREVWLRYGEAFSIAFSVFSRLAPLDVPTRENPSDPREFNLRPPGAGLGAERAVTFSFLVFVLLMLSTVTFDGYLETPLYRSTTIHLYTSAALLPIIEWGFKVGFPVSQTILTGQMALMALGFLAAFWVVSWAMVRSASGSPGATIRVTTHYASVAFVLTLVPIAVAYHLSHYLSLLVINGQLIIPLISDPLGRGWDLFGTASYRVDIGLIGPSVVWYTAMTLIVIGHVIAVFLAHSAAIRVFGSRRAAISSQIPMVFLMVLYTMLSLWLVAQPIVE
jgi:hypothetical protein